MKNKFLKLIVSGLLVCLFTAATPVVAQEANAEPAQLVAEEKGEKTLLDMLAAGGWAMVPLGILSVATFGFAVFNFISIRRDNFINDAVVDELDKACSTLDIDTAHKICAENPSPVTNTFNYGLDQIKQTKFVPDAVEKAFENAAAKELSGPYIIVNYLSIIAALAPMVGLLGTVSGMVKAFNSIASEGMGKPELLADNISEALITTASGMAIAIPAMFFFFFFRNRYGKIVAEVNLVLGRLYADLIRARS